MAAGDVRGAGSVWRRPQEPPEHGERLGRTSGGVVAYANLTGNELLSGEHRVKGIFTGMKWQCVEFARRWLFAERGVVFRDVDGAADIWHLSSVTRPADGGTLALRRFPNGDREAPRAGDLLIYPRSELFPAGHVAVVTRVRLDAGRLELAEQNYENARWRGDHARSIELSRSPGGAVELHDAAPISGWMRVQSD